MACLQASPSYQFRYGSDQSLLIDFGAATGKVAQVAQWLGKQRIPGVVNLHPAYSTILIVFDPCITSHSVLESLLQVIGEVAVTAPRLVILPVHYDGPDLPDVAQWHGVSEQQIIDWHAAPTYEVSFLGFVPGFAYLTGLPLQLSTPRLEIPRKTVLGGSVGIAGNQTGVYPFATPGGWRLLGRTPLTMFRPDRDPMSLLEPGDLVRFLPL